MDDFFFRHVPKWTIGSWVLDLGGHKVRKRGQFDLNQYDLRLVYANLTTEKGADVQSDAETLAFSNDSFDGVICAELLEHVRAPQRVLAEVWRVLKPGGKLLITVPFLYRTHGDPFDFGRYTDYYWQRTLIDVGFQIASLERQGTFFGVVVDFLRQYGDVYYRQPWRFFVRWPARWLARWALQRDAEALNHQDTFLLSFTTGFGIVALKPL